MHCDVCCSLLAISTKLSTTTTIMLQRQGRATIGTCSVTSPQVQVHRPSTWVSYLQLVVCEYEQGGNIPAESTNRCYSVVRTCSKHEPSQGRSGTSSSNFGVKSTQQLRYRFTPTSSSYAISEPARILTNALFIPLC
jgi:hypothetical protein